MTPTELGEVEGRLRQVYERSRLRGAVVAFAPMLILVAAALLLGGGRSSALASGLLLFPLGVFSLWYGRDIGRGVLPGALGGSVACGLALCANHMGHFCTGERCMSWCLPACVAGGVLAGALVGFVGYRQRRGAGYWLSASGVTLLTGALGCSCAGYAGVAGLALGFVGTAGVSAALSLNARRR